MIVVCIWKKPGISDEEVIKMTLYIMDMSAIEYESLNN